MKYIATSVVAMLLLSGCDNTQSNNSSPSETEVGVVTVKSQPVSVVSELTGRTSAALSAEVRPQVGGIIQKRLFKEGDLVKAGQPLYQIDAASYQAAWNEARAALQQAQALVKADCQKAQRYARLVKENGVSQQDADDAQSTCAQDKASVEAKKAALETARINLDWTTVHRTDFRAHWHFVGNPWRTGDRVARYSVNDYSWSGYNVCRPHSLQCRFITSA